MIYVISASGTDYVKIGVASMRTLQTGVPMVLVLIATADWPNRIEGRLHSVLRAAHVRGEWYTACPSIDSLIKHMHSGSTDPMTWMRSVIGGPKRLAKVLAIAA